MQVAADMHGDRGLDNHVAYAMMHPEALLSLHPLGEGVGVSFKGRQLVPRKILVFCC
jgi:hypothetical protein